MINVNDMSMMSGIYTDPFCYNSKYLILHISNKLFFYSKNRSL